MRTGLFGGSFNPIHKGHIRLAESVSDKLGLDRVIFIPSGEAPHKSSADYAGAEDRLRMCRLATEEYKKFSVSDFEINREGKSYSIYTVLHFRQKFPGDELFLMVGSDMLTCFDKWYRFEDILKNVTLAAVTRNGEDMESLRKTAQKLGRYGKIIITDNDPVVISSTKIRQKIKNNEDLYCYLDKKVVEYIMMRRLYL